MIRLLYFTLIFLFSMSYSQFEEEPRTPEGRQDFHPSAAVTYESKYYWGNDTASIKLAIIYRLNPSFLIFTRSTDSQQEYYTARGELGVEILDNKENSVTRDFHQIQIDRNTMPSDGGFPLEKQEGFFIFALSKGIYRPIIEAKDYASGKSFIDRNIQVTLQPFSTGLNISSIFFVELPKPYAGKAEEKKYLAMNQGGNIIIGKKGGCLFQLYSPDSTSDIHLTWKVSKSIISEDDDSLKYQGNEFIQIAGIPQIAEENGRITFSVSEATRRSRVIFIDLPVQKLGKGRYELTIDIGQGTLNIKKNFRFEILWPNEPRSLSNLPLAIDALRHIATEKEIDEMTTLNSRKARREFDEFWQKHNADTMDAYNPRMAEYYRRVDESIKRFSNKDELDGYRTDRGRIYILFGSPSIVNRLLNPDSPPAEIWTYEKLRKQFTFIDRQKNGNFILEKEEKY